MSIEGKKAAYHKVIGLIMEEIEGCGMDQADPETKELMKVVYELRWRIDQSNEVTKKAQKKARKSAPSTQPRRPKQQNPHRWKSGPLASGGGDASIKPPWYEG